MITARFSHERGYATHGDWLKSYHTFSFASYHDPKHMNFSALRVINEDFIAPSGGFAMHPHKNMEILTYVLSGAIAHKDSMSNSQIVPEGEFQLMSAGTSIYHSEFNPSSNEPLHLYQIWIMPSQLSVKPRYEQRRFDDKTGKTLILSPNAEQDSLMVYQDMKLWRYQCQNSQTLNLDNQRKYWLQLTKGTATIADIALQAGDALAISDETTLAIDSTSVEFLLFDLPN